MHELLTEVLARERVARMHEFAARHALLRAVPPARCPWRVALGLALIRAGHRVLRGAPGWVAEPRHSA
jgi:hypothetical protein